MSQSSVETILTLFDDLDAYEAIELVEGLNQRGYSLTIKKINSNIEKSIWEPNTIKNNKVGLVLDEFSEPKKITAIKLVRDPPYNTGGLYDSKTNFDLKGAKEYVELPIEKREAKPFAIGDQNNMEKMLNIMNNEYYGEIRFKLINL